MNYVVLILLVLVLAAIVIYNSRNRQKQGAEEARMRRDITVGTDVMTTSGLYGTVSAIHADDTVTLLISPGVEVRWAFAALRDAAALPERYRGPGSSPQDPPAPDDRV